ncbi:hypothetical protein CL614_08345 [archaeon]|nr:hypothetical protein [archaeon]
MKYHSERIDVNTPEEQATAERLDRESCNSQMSDQQLDGYNHWDDSQGSMHIGTEGECGCGKPRYLLYKYKKPNLNCNCDGKED